MTAVATCLDAWLAQHDPAELLFSVVLAAVIAITSWLAIVTVATVLVELADIERGRRFLAKVTPALVLRVARTSAAFGVAVVPSTTVPVFAPAPSPGADVAARDAQPPVMEWLPDNEPSTLVTPGSGARAPDPGVKSDDAGMTRTRVLVPGDHLWGVADETLQAAWGRQPTDGEVTPYWVRLIKHNRSKLADPNNPDLVFPGQVIELPPVA